MQQPRPDRPTRRRRCGRILAILLAAAASSFASAAAAQAYDPDEMREIRVTRSDGDVALAWTDPAPPPDTHVIRRCTLAALRGGMFGAPYFGNCVATGVVGTNWSEPAPDGSVFYLVSGATAGTEGSLGSSWNGQWLTPRPPTDCMNPETPQPVTFVISLETPQLVCGVQLTISYPAEDLTYGSASCSGLLAGFFGSTNGSVPGLIQHVCGSATGASGAGEISRFAMQRGDCPVGRDAFRVMQCRVLVGDPDCGNTLSEGQHCVVDIQ